MTAKGSLDDSDFWNPTFDYEHRTDGTIVMQQREPLPDYLPTLADYFDQWADDTPDQTWIAKRDQSGQWQHISYGEGRSQVQSIAASLLALGLGPEKPLVILSENSLEHAQLGMACAYAGIPYSPVSPAYSLVSVDHAKLKHIVSLLKPGAIFADDGTDFQAALVSVSFNDHQIISSRNHADNSVTFDSLLSGDASSTKIAQAGINSETVVKYLFTSGSTGSPKAVINTNLMICSMQAMVRDSYRFLMKRPPVVLDWAPWNHTAAGNKVFYLAMTNGGSYYIDEGRPVPGKFDITLSNLKDIACTWYFNVPAGWDRLAEAMEADPDLAEKFFSQLDMMFYAGAGMAQHTWDSLRALARKTTGQEVLLATGIGSTETAPFALACTDVQDKAGNVGVPSRGLSMKLVPSGGKLELRLKGPSITPGYFGDADKTRASFDSEGYYKMGDALRAVNPDDFADGFFFDGRIAENFKLATGTWVAVGAVRSALVDAMDGLIRDAVITGENERELGALLVLSESARLMDADERARVIKDKLTTASGAATGSASRVTRVIILEESPSFDRGEITEKGSLNQRALRVNQQQLINTLYSDGKTVIAIQSPDN